MYLYRWQTLKVGTNQRLSALVFVADERLAVNNNSGRRRSEVLGGHVDIALTANVRLPQKRELLAGWPPRCTSLELTLRLKNVNMVLNVHRNHEAY